MAGRHVIGASQDASLLHRSAMLAGLCALAALPLDSALAQADQAATDNSTDQAGSAASFGLTGGWGGLRQSLAEDGVAIGATEVAETLGNLSGGAKTGAIFEGRLELDLDLDLDKLLGWSALIHVNAYQIHGRGLSGNDLGQNLLTASNIEANRSTRLFDAYVEQGLFDNKLSIRLGQIAADDEFVTSQYAGAFVNATFGFPAIAAADLPGGGPAFPLATPGIRVRYAATDSLSWQTGLFNGNPAGTGASGDPQRQNASGTNFSTNQGAFVITELDYAVAGESGSSQLPAAYKIGAWYHGGEFDDLRFDQSGLSLANPGSTLPARRHQGDAMIYAVVDHMLWRAPNTDDHGLSAFLRLAGAPDADRNLVSFYADGGLVDKAPFEGRDDDIVGLALSLATISAQAQALDRDVRSFGAAGYPVRDYEGLVEATYQYELTPWWVMQPDLQYILHPGGHAPNPAIPGAVTPMHNALILGLRSSIKL
jgi:porin